MSAPTHVDRCRQWLLEQIETMGTLRTSNVRDLNFKSWRQNTVTAIQRIWPNDRERVERFRRVVFTPPHAKPDAKLSREWFGKGIGESRAYLQSLLEIIEREGVPEGEDAELDVGSDSMEAEVGFPMLDLDETSAAASAAGDDALDSPGPAGDPSVTSGYTSPDEQGATPRDPASPAPPSLSLRWRMPSLAALSRKEMNAPPAESAPPALGESATRARPVQDERPTVEIPRAPSLHPAAGSEEVAAAEAPAADAAETAPSEAPSAPKAEAPAPAKPVAPAAPKAEAPAPAKPAAPAAPKAEAPAPAKPAAPAASAPSREAASKPAPRPKNGRKTRRAAPKATPTRMMPRPKLKDMLGFDEFEARADAEAAAATPGSPAAEVKEPVAAAPKAEAPAPAKPAGREPEPAPVEAVAPAPQETEAPEPEPEPDEAPEPAHALAAEPSAEEADSEDEESLDLETEAAFEADRARATVDFLLNSPVFGAVGKPVQRRTDTTEFLDPDAVALATYAVDLGRLGVPDAMRVSLAARLIDVARHIESGDLDWALLRASVTDAMQYPQLARRLLPVLLPWLERAA